MMTAKYGNLSGQGMGKKCPRIDRKTAKKPIASFLLWKLWSSMCPSVVITSIACVSMACLTETTSVKAIFSSALCVLGILNLYRTHLWINWNNGALWYQACWASQSIVYVYLSIYAYWHMHLKCHTRRCSPMRSVRGKPELCDLFQKSLDDFRASGYLKKKIRDWRMEMRVEGWRREEGTNKTDWLTD